VEQLFKIMSRILFRFQNDNIPSSGEILEVYDYVLSQSIDEVEQNLSVDDAPYGVHTK